MTAEGLVNEQISIRVRLRLCVREGRCVRKVGVTSNFSLDFEFRMETPFKEMNEAPSKDGPEDGIFDIKGEKSVVLPNTETPSNFRFCFISRSRIKLQEGNLKLTDKDQV